MVPALNRFRALAGASALALLVGSPAFAAAAAEPAVLDELLVTGTRIVRDGYAAPTPVTTVGIDQLKASAPMNLPDGLNRLPQFSGSSTRTFCCAAASVGNYLNLRGLGAQRTLVLLDGERVTPTTDNGLVDVNLLPEMLIQRVDVVTGGASAAYGSDAVSGVINYVTDIRFTGVKGMLQAGTSKYEDDDSTKYGIALGTKFGDGKGHAVFSYEHFQAAGIPNLQSRPTSRRNYILGGNGSAAAPFRNVTNTTYLTTTFGGLIVNGVGFSQTTPTAPLAGLMFLPGGATAPFTPGAAIPGTAIAGVGGDGSVNNLMQPQGALRFDHFYGRVSYEFTPNVTGYLRAYGGESRTRNRYATDNRQLTTAFTIFNDNAFLSADIRNRMAAAGATSFRLARTNRDFGLLRNDTLNDAFDVRAGLEGSFGKAWRWNASYGHGETILRSNDANNTVIANLYAAVDAVRDANGAIVCRVTITNPGVFPGCAPVNLFGEGAPSSAALAFFLRPDNHEVRNKQDVLSANLTGDLLALPAGMVSIALGAELRGRTLIETSNPIATSQINGTGIRGLPGAFCPTLATCRFGGFNQGNYGTASASDTVKEVYAEAAAPILRDVPLAQALELNGAIRYTDYTASGGVTTWKIGLSDTVTEDLRIRITRSRDIRAPNLFELYSAPATAFTPGLIDPLTGQTNVLSPTITQGNVNLRPETADTFAVGFVYSPQWIKGFSGSIDYYRINVKDGIRSTTAQATLNACAAGDSAACALISRAPGANTISSIILQQVNIGKNHRTGIDFDLSYAAPLEDWMSTDARLSIRALFTRVLRFSETIGTRTTQLAGFSSATDQTLTTPKWKGSVSARYDNGPFGLFVQERFISGYTLTPIVPNGIFVDPKFPSVRYTDVTASYKLTVRDVDYELYATVNNLFNKQPPPLGNIFAPGLGYPTIPLLYDLTGRYYTAGIRFQF